VGNAVPQIFLRDAVTPSNIRTRQNGYTVAFPPNRLAKK